MIQKTIRRYTGLHVFAWSLGLMYITFLLSGLFGVLLSDESLFLLPAFVVGTGILLSPLCILFFLLAYRRNKIQKVSRLIFFIGMLPLLAALVGGALTFSLAVLHPPGVGIG